MNKGGYNKLGSIVKWIKALQSGDHRLNLDALMKHPIEQLVRIIRYTARKLEAVSRIISRPYFEENPYQTAQILWQFLNANRVNITVIPPGHGKTYFLLQMAINLVILYPQSENLKVYIGCEKRLFT